MFRCDDCKAVALPRTSPTRVVTARRDKTYPPRAARRRRVVERPRLHSLYPEFDAPRGVEDQGGRGSEIAAEVVLCAPCALKRVGVGGAT